MNYILQSNKEIRYHPDLFSETHCRAGWIKTSVWRILINKFRVSCQLLTGTLTIIITVSDTMLLPSKARLLTSSRNQFHLLQIPKNMHF